MNISVRQEPGRLMVNLVGRVDEEGAARLKSELAAAENADVREVVLDVGGVTFIGSAGIGKLLVLYNKVTKRNVSIRLINVPSEIFALFHSLKLDQLFSLSKN
jgi:anti-anti-sigma factor